MTSTGDGVHDLGRMPCTNASHLAETLVCLARELTSTPTVSNTLEAMTLRDGNNIHNLVLLEHRANLDRLLEEAMGVLDLVRDAASIDLDLHKMRLLLLEACLADLCVRKDTHDGAVLANALELACDGLAAVLCVFLGVPGEGLFL